MIRVDRRLLAWVVSVVVVLLAVMIAVRAVWPDGIPWGGRGGFGALSLAFPSLAALPLVIANVVLSVIARRRGGRAASIGSVCLSGITALVVLTVAASLMTPAVMARASGLVIALLLLLALGGTLPTQMVVLAVLAFALIGSPRVPRAAS